MKELVKDIEEYIGDGVYVSYDGYHYTLDLRAQAPTLPITKIVMEPPVLKELLRFIDRMETTNHDGTGNIHGADEIK